MYSLDVNAQYRKMEQQKKKRERNAAVKARLIETWRQTKSGRGKAPRVSGDRVQQEALADHLQAMLAKQPGGVMLSVPYQNMPMMSLQTALSVPGHQPQVPHLENRPQLEHDVEDHRAVPPPGAAAAESQLLCFRVVPVHLHRQKMISLPAASARKLTKHDICVTVHACHSFSDKHIVALEASRGTSVQGPVSVLSLCDVELPVVRDHLTAWVTRKSPCFLLDGVSDEVVERAQPAVKKLVSCRAFPKSEEGLQTAACDADLNQQLQMLRGVNLVECLPDSPGPGRFTWRFSSSGAQKLRVASELRCPELVFQKLTDLSLESLEDATCWQLCDALERKGFHARPRPRTKKAMSQLPPHLPDSANLLYYLPGTSLQRSRKYIMALLRSEDLFSAGVLQRVHHCQPIEYYSQILQGYCSGSPLQAIENGEADDSRPPPLQVDGEGLPPVANAIPDAALPVPPRKRARRSLNAERATDDDGAVDEALKQLVDEVDEDSGGLSSESLSSDVLYLSGSDEEAVEHKQDPGCGADDGGGVGSPVASPGSSVFRALSDLEADNQVEAAALEPPAVPGRAEEPPASFDEPPVPMPAVPSPPPDALENADGVASALGGARASDSRASGSRASASRPSGSGRPPDDDAAETADGVASAHGDARARASGSRQVHQDTFQWGPFRMTFSGPEKRPKFGSWQAACPYHKLSEVTMCKKAIGLRNETAEEKQNCLRLLKLWCLQAPNHDRRRHHNNVNPRVAELLDDSVLEARLEALSEPPSRENLQDDAALDAAAATAAAKGRAKAKAKPGAKVKPKSSSKSKAKAKPKPAAAPAAAPSDEAASDPPSSSRSDSSDSSSSSSGSSSDDS